MILEVYKKECTRNDLIAVYGGRFDFDYSPIKKEIRITTQAGATVYPCTKIDFSVDGTFVYALTEK